MQLKELEYGDLSEKMRKGNIGIDLGVASFRVKSKLPDVQKVFYELYSDYSIVGQDDPTDFQVSIQHSFSLRRWFKPQISFSLDQYTPFLPLPRSQAYPLLEWGMNWCMAAHQHNFLLIHGAILEKNDEALIFPAPPGSGKSTLCAYLANSGWRLLSDEMTVINLETGLAHPFVRPICLKNNSIDLVKEWFPDVVVSNIAKDTSKGTVAHVKPPERSVLDLYKTAKVRAIVLPHFTPDKKLDIYTLNKIQAYESLSSNAFNEGMLGVQGFKAMTRLIEQTDTVEIFYNDLNSVMEFLTEGVFTL
ncbi:MAG: HprK-related kinase A [Paraglaciecola sp.]|uniref:HprK-related kinase A n=1 Tax=Paraglaciecola sp. TaxID=1920173 RepID=UPI00326540A1